MASFHRSTSNSSDHGDRKQPLQQPQERPPHRPRGNSVLDDTVPDLSNNVGSSNNSGSNGSNQYARMHLERMNRSKAGPSSRNTLTGSTRRTQAESKDILREREKGFVTHFNGANIEVLEDQRRREQEAGIHPPSTNFAGKHHRHNNNHVGVSQSQHQHQRWPSSSTSSLPSVVPRQSVSAGDEDNNNNNNDNINNTNNTNNHSSSTSRNSTSHRQKQQHQKSSGKRILRATSPSSLASSATRQSLQSHRHRNHRRSASSSSSVQNRNNTNNSNSSSASSRRRSRSRAGRNLLAGSGRVGGVGHAGIGRRGGRRHNAPRRTWDKPKKPTESILSGLDGDAIGGIYSRVVDGDSAIGTGNSKSKTHRNEEVEDDEEADDSAYCYDDDDFETLEDDDEDNNSSNKNNSTHREIRSKRYASGCDSDLDDRVEVVCGDGNVDDKEDDENKRSGNYSIGNDHIRTQTTRNANSIPAPDKLNFNKSVSTPLYNSAPVVHKLGFDGYAEQQQQKQRKHRHSDRTLESASSSSSSSMVSANRQKRQRKIQRGRSASIATTAPIATTSVLDIMDNRRMTTCDSNNNSNSNNKSNSLLTLSGIRNTFVQHDDELVALHVDTCRPNNDDFKTDGRQNLPLGGSATGKKSLQRRSSVPHMSASASLVSGDPKHAQHSQHSQQTNLVELSTTGANIGEAPKPAVVHYRRTARSVSTTVSPTFSKSPIGGKPAHRGRRHRSNTTTSAAQYSNANICPTNGYRLHSMSSPAATTAATSSSSPSSSAAVTKPWPSWYQPHATDVADTTAPHNNNSNTSNDSNSNRRAGKTGNGYNDDIPSGSDDEANDVLHHSTGTLLIEAMRKLPRDQQEQLLQALKGGESANTDTNKTSATRSADSNRSLSAEQQQKQQQHMTNEEHKNYSGSQQVSPVQANPSSAEAQVPERRRQRLSPTVQMEDDGASATTGERRTHLTTTKEHVHSRSQPLLFHVRPMGHSSLSSLDVKEAADGQIVGLRVEILSTWGNSNIVGLTSVEMYDNNNKQMPMHDARLTLRVCSKNGKEDDTNLSNTTDKGKVVDSWNARDVNTTAEADATIESELKAGGGVGEVSSASNANAAFALGFLLDGEHHVTSSKHMWAAFKDGQMASVDMALAVKLSGHDPACHLMLDIELAIPVSVSDVKYIKLWNFNKGKKMCGAMGVKDARVSVKHQHGHQLQQQQQHTSSTSSMLSVASNSGVNSRNSCRNNRRRRDKENDSAQHSLGFEVGGRSKWQFVWSGRCNQGSAESTRDYSTTVWLGNSARARSGGASRSGDDGYTSVVESNDKSASQPALPMLSSSASSSPRIRDRNDNTHSQRKLDSTAAALHDQGLVVNLSAALPSLRIAKQTSDINSSSIGNSSSARRVTEGKSASSRSKCASAPVSPHRSASLTLVSDTLGGARAGVASSSSMFTAMSPAPPKTLSSKRGTRSRASSTLNDADVASRADLRCESPSSTLSNTSSTSPINSNNNNTTNNNNASGGVHFRHDHRRQRQQQLHARGTDATSSSTNDTNTDAITINLSKSSSPPPPYMDNSSSSDQNNNNSNNIDNNSQHHGHTPSRSNIDSRTRGVISEMGKEDEEDNEEDEEDSMTDCFHVPVLPRGSVLRVEILSTWGDPHYVGLNAIEVFADDGSFVTLSDVHKQIKADPPDINVLHEYTDDPRTADKLVDKVKYTCDDQHMWLAPFSSSREQGHCVELTLDRPISLAMLRIWNYNKSRIHSYRGVRRVRILLDKQIIMEGEITKAPGCLGGIDECSEIILFTSDTTRLAAIEDTDIKVNGWFLTQDQTHELVMAKLSQLRSARPGTGSDTDSSNSNTNMNNTDTNDEPYGEREEEDEMLAIRKAGFGSKQNQQRSVSVPVSIDMNHSSRSNKGNNNNSNINNSRTRVASHSSGSNFSNTSSDNNAAVTRRRNSNNNKNPDSAVLLRPARVKQPDVSFAEALHGELKTRAIKNNRSPLSAFNKHQAIEISDRPRTCTARRQPTAASIGSISPRSASRAQQQNEGILNHMMLPLPRGRVITLNIAAAWGAKWYVGMTGVAVVVCKESTYTNETTQLHKVFVTGSNRLRARPHSDINVNGHSGDHRTLDKLTDGINQTCDENHMWMIPLSQSHSSSNQPQSHSGRDAFTSMNGHSQELTLDLGTDCYVAGICVWNYNKNLEDTRRGVKRMHMRVDNETVSPEGGFLVRKAPGVDCFDFGQMLMLRTKQQLHKQADTVRGVANAYESPIITGRNRVPHFPTHCNNNNNNMSRFNGSHRATSPVVQDWEAPVHPFGFIFRLELVGTFGDQYYIGLNGLQLFDAEGLPVNVKHICASPESVNVLNQRNKNGRGSRGGGGGEGSTGTTGSTGEKLDSRVCGNLLNGVNHVGCGHNSWLAPLASTLSPRSKPNTIYLAFDEPVALSMIKVWNYTKTPSRGAREVMLWVDDVLTFHSELQEAPGEEAGSNMMGNDDFAQTLLFTDDEAVIHKHKHSVHYCGKNEQAVTFIDNFRVVCGAAPQRSNINAPADLSQRPTTSLCKP